MNSSACVDLRAQSLFNAMKFITNIIKQNIPMQWRQEQYQNGKVPLLTIIASENVVLTCVSIAGQTKYLLSVWGIINPRKDNKRGIRAPVRLDLGTVYWLEGLWKLNLLKAMPQLKKVRLYRQQYLQNRLELFTNYGSLYSRQIISLMNQKAGTLARMKRIEKALGVVFAIVYFITTIFQFIISDTYFRAFVLKQPRKTRCKDFIFCRRTRTCFIDSLAIRYDININAKNHIRQVKSILKMISLRLKQIRQL